MLLVMILAAGSLLYWAEGDAQPDKFGSIPRAMWWAIVTLTTVGYGDTFPITPLGKILAGVIAIMGVMLIALPTGLFAASFTEAMERERGRRAKRSRPHVKQPATRRNDAWIARLPTVRRMMAAGEVTPEHDGHAAGAGQQGRTSARARFRLPPAVPPFNTRTHRIFSLDLDRRFPARA